MLTSFPPQPCNAAPQHTQDHSAAATLPYTNPVAHILTQKTCVANHNKICPKATQEDTADGSVSSMPGPSQYDPASLPTYRCRTHKFNSLLIVPRIQPGGIFKYFSRITFFFSYTILLPSFAPFLWTSSRNSSRPSNSS
jgi:hypothetical protein